MILYDGRFQDGERGLSLTSPFAPAELFLTGSRHSSPNLSRMGWIPPFSNPHYTSEQENRVIFWRTFIFLSRITRTPLASQKIDFEQRLADRKPTRDTLASKLLRVAVSTPRPNAARPRSWLLMWFPRCGAARACSLGVPWRFSLPPVLQRTLRTRSSLLHLRIPGGFCSGYL